MKKYIVLLGLFVSMVSQTVYAGIFLGAVDPKNSPSVFSYGWSGLRLGTLVGASIGGLQAIDQHEKLDDSGEADRIGNGAIYGLLGGTALGLGIGFYDLSQGQTGVGALILRDMWYGGALGLFVGAAIGGLTYSKTEDSKDVGSSIAWGYIGGTAVGLLFGFIESPLIVQKPLENQDSPVRLAVIPDSDMNMTPLLVYRTRF
ncbi:MAG: hypothetical protein GF384_01880 [Elusimicrobia bacterium]|nr:hypothetical protein [Elusimicrobiota bacterium]MBD3411741.1 hypothetical protein [Elusimicrobiota bacterium]